MNSVHIEYSVQSTITAQLQAYGLIEVTEPSALDDSDVVATDFDGCEA